MIRVLTSLTFSLAAGAAASAKEVPPAAARPVDFIRDVQPILNEHCTDCHGADKQKGGFRLDVKRVAMEGGDNHAPNIHPGKSAESPLIRFVAGLDADMIMPPKGNPLTDDQIGVLRAWIDQGAVWPESAGAEVDVKPDWWSLKPLIRPAVPPHGGDAGPVDAFISEKLAAKGLTMAGEADARTLCRRVYFDLTGLPPSPDEMEAFVADPAPDRYARLVDKLLASPRYGERWARHWLDIVHYGDTHGYDKDQPRPNAWPFRDYVIRSFNEDKPYARFVQEQVAGDVLFPGTADGIEALGFIAAGPWDFIGHAEVPEEKIDGKIARHLDRDDMIATTVNTFCSVTVHCAQCHDHKFDPISQEDYYSLQAVFSALDRADKEYDSDPAITAARSALKDRQAALKKQIAEINGKALHSAGDVLTALDKKIESAGKPAGERAAAFGWHSAITDKQDQAKWVQVDLGRKTGFGSVVIHPTSDSFNGIGDGFGFPVRFKIEASDDPAFTAGVVLLADETNADYKNPGIRALTFPAAVAARFIRFTATKLAPRQGDYIFAVAELEVLDGMTNVAAGARVTALDSVDAPVRWHRENLTDGWYPGIDPARLVGGDTANLEQARRQIVEAAIGEKALTDLTAAEKELSENGKQLAALPAPRRVYAGTVFTGGGTFKGTGASGGKPRPVFMLPRGDVTKPGRQVIPGALTAVASLPARFALPEDAPESARRAALAKWLTDPQHPLTWRSIVNRVWQYHFGRGIADSPNDLGRMGSAPVQPELLDWLACEFRDSGGSFKKLHRLIVLSATYRQRSDVTNEAAEKIDSDNQLLWKMNRRKLEAEAVRDSVLAVAGKLDLTMGGPAFQDFVVERPEHSPHYQYHLADAANPAYHRRSVYRFLARSKPQPWMTALDCADPSMLVEKRNQTITPLQALAQLNNQLMLVMARDFAERVQKEGGDLPAQINRAFRLAVQRTPTASELADVCAYAATYGMPNACRVLLNLNEFSFID